MPPSSPSPQQQAKTEGDQRTAAGKEMVVVVEKDGRSDVVDKETGRPEEISIQQQEMVVVVEKEDGSDVEQQLPAKAPLTSMADPKVAGVARRSASSDREIRSLWNLVVVWCEVRWRARQGGCEEKNGNWNWLHGQRLRKLGEETGRRRQSRPRRERVREKEKSSPTREDYARYRHVLCLT